MANEIVETKIVTTKELAEVLNVSARTVQETVSRLGLAKVLSQVKIRGQNAYVFNEEQATLVKVEIQKHHNLNSRQIENVTTEQEEDGKIFEAMQILQRRAEKYKQRAEIAEKQLIEQKPKVAVYDNICNSETLLDLQTAAQNLKIKNIFKLLTADRVIEKKHTNDGQSYYKNYASYNDYFETKNSVWTDREGVPHTRPRLFVTGRGLTWLSKRYNLQPLLEGIA